MARLCVRVLLVDAISFILVRTKLIGTKLAGWVSMSHGKLPEIMSSSLRVLRRANERDEWT